MRTFNQKGQITIELLMNILLAITLVGLFLGATFAIQKHALHQTKKLNLLIELQEIAEQFNLYFNSAYLTKSESMHYLSQTEFLCQNQVCYKLVNNTIVAEYDENGEKRILVAHTLLYKDVGYEPV